MIWRQQDPHIPAEGRAKIRTTLNEAKLRYTFHERNAQHAFMRDAGPRYDPALALVSYRMVLDLFARVA